MKIRNLYCAGVICALVLTTFPANAQDVPGPFATPTPPSLTPPYAIVTYPAADATAQAVSVVSPCTDGIFALVGLQPDQVVQVVVQYPTAEALQLVNLEALDGGIILPPRVEGTAPPAARDKPDTAC